MQRCEFTGKRPLVGHKVSHSNIKTLRRQFPNLQEKRVWNPHRKCWMRLKLSTRAIRTLDKIGVEEFCRRAGIAY